MAILRTLEQERTSTVKPYFVSRNEWKAGVLVLASVIFLRAFCIRKADHCCASCGPPPPPKIAVPRTQLYPSSIGSRGEMLNTLLRYCLVEAHVLCSPVSIRRMNGCPDIPPALLFIWGYCFPRVLTRLPQYEWWNETIDIDEDLWKELVVSPTVSLDDLETKVIVQLGVYSMLIMYKRTLSGLRNHDMLESVSFPDEADRLIEHHFSALLDLLGTKGKGCGDFDVDGDDKHSKRRPAEGKVSLWQRDEILSLMRFAIHFVQLPRVKPMVLERIYRGHPFRRYMYGRRGFYDLFLPRVIHVMEKLENGKGESPLRNHTRAEMAGESTPLHYHTRAELTNRQRFYHERESNDCMFDYYESRRLITEHCQVAMMEGMKLYPFLPKGAALNGFDKHKECMVPNAFARWMLSPICLVLLARFLWLVRCREGLKQKADVRRRQLRRVLERRFPPARKEEASAEIEKAVANWDSKDIAIRKLRRLVRRYRVINAALASAWVLGLVWMRLFRPGCPFGLYLDNLLAPIALFVASYFWIPMDLERDEILQGLAALEMQETLEPLLAEDTPLHGAAGDIQSLL